MRRVTFAFVAAATIALAACGRSEDVGDNVDANAVETQELNDLANAAANDAEADALGNQLDQLNAENEAAADPADDLVNQSEVDAAVNGM